MVVGRACETVQVAALRFAISKSCFASKIEGPGKKNLRFCSPAFSSFGAGNVLLKLQVVFYELL